ncbi:MAG TPA: ArsR family transcriptional regulator [Deinococcales bacterium]|nr:ArsR family transcriptional regulator [Deinococcales bacterium]
MSPTPASTTSHPSSKGRVLAALKSRGSSAAGDLAGALGISGPAVRRHLADLQAAGLVETRLGRPSGRGRPQHLYQLTRKGEMSFPQHYADLCLQILTHLRALDGSDAVLRVLDARNAELDARWRPRITGATLPERARALAAAASELDYDATVPDGDTLVIEHSNCPALEVARHFPVLCDKELELYEGLLGVTIRRETRIAAGNLTCRFVIRAARH